MKKTILLLLCLSFYFVGQAQEVIPASGGNASGSSGSASYSIGQTSYTTNTGTNGTVAQGIQQPFEISVVTGINEVKGIVLQCSAYPNPVTNYVILSPLRKV
jgi:hypothetical protein